MPGLIMHAPVPFADASLPVVPTVPIPSIPGAVHDWAVDALPAGALPVWYDRISGAALTAPENASQRPTVTTDPTYGKVVRFNGTNQRLDAAVDMTGSKTMIVVARWHTIAASSHLIVGPSGYWHIYINGATKYGFLTAAGSVSLGSVAPTPAMHVITGVSGTPTIVRVDGTEGESNTPGPATATAFRVGATQTGYTACDVQRIVVLPYAATPTERSAIEGILATHYDV